MEDLNELNNQPVSLSQKESEEAEKAYLALLPLAMGLSEGVLQTFRGSIDIARQNAMRAYEEFKKVEEKLSNIVKTDLIESLQRLPAVALAASFATIKVNNLSTHYEPGSIKLLEEGRSLRRRLLKSVDACSEYGIIPVETVVNIQKGRGSRDIANDCVALAAVFREHKDKLVGKTPVPPEDVDQCASVGSKLVTGLKTKGASKAKALSEEELEAYDIRDRFWTLLVQYRDAAWRLVALIVGEQKVNELVPALLSRERPTTPNTPEVKQARQEATVAKEKAKAAEKEAKEKAKAATKAAKDARKKK